MPFCGSEISSDCSSLASNSKPPKTIDLVFKKLLLPSPPSRRRCRSPFLCNPHSLYNLFSFLWTLILWSLMSEDEDNLPTSAHFHQRLGEGGIDLWRKNVGGHSNFSAGEEGGGRKPISASISSVAQPLVSTSILFHFQLGWTSRSSSIFWKEMG